MANGSKPPMHEKSNRRKNRRTCNIVAGERKYVVGKIVVAMVVAIVLASAIAMGGERKVINNTNQIAPAPACSKARIISTWPTEAAWWRALRPRLFVRSKVAAPLVHKTR